ncbi:MAG TPA: apolipoprotein N-acyltransferase [Lacipirellulaceae bacterium]|nr:apolipoprotein N-acyltransferase [Lacipirellulaceae bacterium]
MNLSSIRVPAWCRSALVIGLVGSLLMWASLPPLALSWLGWVAPIPWLLLVSVTDLPGRRPYLSLYFAGFVFWLLAIYWLILPYPKYTWLGWLALSSYLAIYLPAFVGLARAAKFRFALPYWLSAPIVWTGLELARAHLLTGFLMGSLAHSQVHWNAVIQFSDLVGEYGVDFLIVLVASCATELLWEGFINPRAGIKRRGSKFVRCGFAILPAIVAISVVLVYGHFRIDQIEQIERTATVPGPRIALIQGNSLAEWKQDPNRERQIMEEYISLSEKAVTHAHEVGDGRPVDLIVWPETMYRNPLYDFEDGYKPPPESKFTADEIVAYDLQQLANLAAHLGAPLLVGIDRIHFVADDRSVTDRPTMSRYNSAALVSADGKIVGTYDKMHRVMFGEYIPFADWVPYLYKITPLTGGIIAGEKPAALHVDDKYCFSPNICYETAVPHVIRRQVATLESNGDIPDALVNLTNDAWYWGSSELDLHLACDVFRTVETRVPLVIAANGGITASIDRTGQVVAQCKRQSSEFLIADIAPGNVAETWYVRLGDWFAGACLACCIALSIVEWRARRALRRRSIPPTEL